MNKSYSYRHLANHALKPTLSGFLESERGSLADGLAVMAEVDARRRYLPAAYPSMVRYLVGEHGMSPDEAYLRIRVARCARRFPAIFPMIEEGMLGMTSVLLLAPRLTPEIAAGLLARAANRTVAELAELLAERFPRPDLPTLVQAIGPELDTTGSAPATAASHGELASKLVERPADGSGPAPGSVGARPATPDAQLVSKLVAPPAPHPKVTPLAPERYAWQVTVSREANDKLRRARELLSHAVPSGDMAQVLERALDALIEKCERRKHAATGRPRQRRISAHGNRIPAEVKRDVRQRDGGRCAFVSEQGKRCEERRFLEYDHAVPVARGGRSTADNVRLRCRAHNQHAADCAFGRGFMDEKREQRRQRSVAPLRSGAAAGTARKAAAAAAGAPRTVKTAAAVAPSTRTPVCTEAERAAAMEVIPWLREFGRRPDAVGPVAARGEAIPDAPA